MKNNKNIIIQSKKKNEKQHIKYNLLKYGKWFNNKNNWFN